MNGAGERSRTPDLLITSQLLYQLSYAGLVTNKSIQPYNALGSRAASDGAEYSASGTVHTITCTHLAELIFYLLQSGICRQGGHTT